MTCSNDKYFTWIFAECHVADRKVDKMLKYATVGRVAVDTAEKNNLLLETERPISLLPSEMGG
jgi:hypothetical protein